MTKQEQINSLPHRYHNMWREEIVPNIFVPRSVEDIQNLNVTFEEVITRDQKELWWASICMLSTWINQYRHPGKNTSWFIKNGRQYLGILRLSGETANGKARDAAIGWTQKNKFTDRKLQNVNNLQAVIPFRTFGNRCLGGKLITKLAQADPIIGRFDAVWHTTTVLLTAVSLNPCPCQYNSIPDWKYVGKTGSGKPTFLCPLYANWIGFLRAETDKLSERRRTSIEDVMNWWRPKAIIRFEKTEGNQETYFDAGYEPQVIWNESDLFK